VPETTKVLHGKSGALSITERHRPGKRPTGATALHHGKSHLLEMLEQRLPPGEVVFSGLLPLGWGQDEPVTLKVSRQHFPT
jgi:hypothetical protein